MCGSSSRSSLLNTERAVLKRFRLAYSSAESYSLWLFSLLSVPHRSTLGRAFCFATMGMARARPLAESSMVAGDVGGFNRGVHLRVLELLFDLPLSLEHFSRAHAWQVCAMLQLHAGLYGTHGNSTPKVIEGTEDSLATWLGLTFAIIQHVHICI